MDFDPRANYYIATGRDRNNQLGTLELLVNIIVRYGTSCLFGKCSTIDGSSLSDKLAGETGCPNTGDEIPGWAKTLRLSHRKNQLGILTDIARDIKERSRGHRSHQIGDEPG